MSASINTRSTIAANVLIGDRAKVVKFVAWTEQHRVVAKTRGLSKIYVKKIGGKYIASNDKAGDDVIASAGSPQKAFEVAVETVWVQ